MSLMTSNEVYLVGVESAEMPKDQLPTNRQVLSLFHYQRRLQPNEKTNKLISTIIDEVYALWHRAEVPTREKSSSVRKFQSLHEKWKSLGKTRTQGTQMSKVQEFIDDLDNLFDVRRKNVDVPTEKIRETLTAKNQRGINFEINNF